MARVAYQMDEISGEWEYVPCRATEKSVIAHWKRQDKQNDTPPVEYQVTERYPLEHGELIEMKIEIGDGRPYLSWLLLCPEDQVEVAQEEVKAIAFPDMR